MKQLITLLSIILVVPFYSSAQDFSTNVWHSGVVDLNSGESIRGQLKYDLKDERVLLIVNNQVKAYPVNIVESFSIKDALSNQSRIFFSIPHTLYNDYSRNHFFELLSEGQMSLLSRQEIVMRKVRYDVTNGYLYSNRNYPVPHEEENYFLMDSEGGISACGNTNKDVIEFFSDYSKEIKAFIRSNKLDVNFRYDMMHVIEYYNTLKTQD